MAFARTAPAAPLSPARTSAAMTSSASAVPPAADEVSLLSAAALSSLMQGEGGPPLVLEAVMGHGSSGQAFIPGAVLFSLSEIDVYLEDETGSPLPIAGNFCLRGPAELRAALERHGVQAGRRCVVYTQCRRHTAIRAALGERGHHHRYRPATAREGVSDVIVAARLVWCALTPSRSPNPNPDPKPKTQTHNPKPKPKPKP